MNLSGVVDSLGTTTALAVTRRGAASIVNGLHVPGSTTSLQMTAVVVPASPEDTQVLPEGRRTERILQLFTKEPLQTPRIGVGAGDLVAVAGESYEVLHVEDWTSSGAFCRSLAVRSTP